MPDRPNILLIIADQYRWDCMSGLGHPVVQTPHLDDLAADGVLFGNAHCAAMACGPARASLFTGEFADRHGQQGNESSLAPPDRPTIPDHLVKANYDTALVGKLHIKPFERDYGFRHFVRHDAPYTNYYPNEAHESAYVAFLADALFGRDKEAPIRAFTEDEACLDTDEKRFMLGTDVARRPELHEAAWAVDESIRYLSERRDKSKPFFLNIGFYGPHQPYLCPPPWDTSLYPPDSIPLPPEFDYPVEDKPVLLGSGYLKRREAREQRGWTEKGYREILSAYYAYCAWIDHNLGRLFAAMREEGVYDDTLVVFTSDHGDFAGQYRLFYKGTPHEGATHVPFVVRDPRTTRKGERDDAAVSTIDLFATCLAAAGAPPPEGSPSRDLGPVFAGDRDGWDDRALFKRKNTSAIVRGRGKLMRGDFGGEPAYEMYDLANDPMERDNLYGKPEHVASAEALRAELDPWHDEMEAGAVEGPNVRCK